jgi:ABC-type multidrug transport system permease subunit
MGKQDLYWVYNKKYLEMSFKRKQNELASINRLLITIIKKPLLKSKKLSSSYQYIRIISIVLASILISILLYFIVKIRRQNKTFQKEIQQIIRT